jgi:hypothetical protein
LDVEHQERKRAGMRLDVEPGREVSRYAEYRHVATCIYFRRVVWSLLNLAEKSIFWRATAFSNRRSNQIESFLKMFFNLAGLIPRKMRAQYWRPVGVSLDIPLSEKSVLLTYTYIDTCAHYAGREPIYHHFEASGEKID